MAEHIHPIFDSMLTKKEKESLLKQHGIVVWMTGLSGSGKSTLARGLERQLHNNGFLTKLLDGDNLRTGLNKDLGFSAEDRTENIRRVAETAKLFAECGVIVICSFVSPTQDIRAMARSIIGEKTFMEVLVEASYDTCAERDVKGLYKKALKGEIKNFTGLDAPFEKPVSPSLVVNTEKNKAEDCIQLLYHHVENRIVFK